MWIVRNSEVFTERERERIGTKLKNRISLEGILQMTVSENRTQLQNKRIATERIQKLVNNALLVPKKRIATTPSRSQKEKRLESKKKISEKKENRKFKF